jgi:uncharacterized membrane protein HdeD (DUF308 family)
MMSSTGESVWSLPIAFWVTLARAILAIVLGLALILHPDKARPMLVNFMGMFWLVSGIMSLRWGASGRQARRLSVVAGVIGVLAGLITIARNIIKGVLGEVMVIYLLGGVILLTGIAHVLGGFRIAESAKRQWSWTAFVLGVFEIVLGGLLLISPLELGPLVYWAASVWAFVGAFMLIADALRQRAEHVGRARS